MLYCLYCSNLSNINFKKVLTKVKKKKLMLELYAMKVARTVLRGFNIVKYYLASTDPSNFYCS